VPAAPVAEPTLFDELPALREPMTFGERPVDGAAPPGAPGMGNPAHDV